MKTDNGEAATAAALAIYAAQVGAVTMHTPALCARAAHMMSAADRALKAWWVRAANVPMTEAQKARGENRLQRLQDQANAWLAADVCGGKGEAPRFDCTTGMGAVLVIPGSHGNGFGADRGAWSFSN
jgi:hypothetical protein